MYLDLRELENIHERLVGKLDNHFQKSCPVSKRDLRLILDIIGELESYKERELLETYKGGCDEK